MSLRFFEIAEANVRIHNPINEKKLMKLGAICSPTPQITISTWPAVRLKRFVFEL